MFLNHALHGNLLPISILLFFGIPIGNSAVGVGNGCEGETGALGRGLTDEGRNDVCCWAAGSSIEHMAGYRVLGSHFGGDRWVWEVRGDDLESCI